MNKKLSIIFGLSIDFFGQNLLLPILFLFIAGNVWGQTTATYTFSTLGTSNITLPSGNIDGNIAYTTSTGTAGSATQYNGGGSDLRLYNNTTNPYNGGAIILTPQNGATITAVEFTTASTYTPTMRYSIGAANLTAADPSISRTSLTYSVTGLGVTSSIRIRNANTSTLQIRMLTVKVIYTGGSPTITSPTTTLTGFSTTTSAPSATQAFNISGSALTNDITITPPTNYEISTIDGVGFTATNPITLTQTGGAVATTPIYVRLKSGLTLGAYNLEDINITSSGATARKVTVSGDVVRRTITSTTSGDWNTGSTWVGGVAPTSADNVVIATGHTVSVGSSVTRDTGTTTTVNGSFQLNNGGYAGGTPFTYAATGSGLIFNSGSLYGVDAGNAFWPSSNPPFNITVNSGSGAKLNTSVGAVAGTLALAGQLDAVNTITVNGTLQLNGGGYVSSNAPVYGSSSSLIYNTNYGIGLEWTGNGTNAGAGIPNNVTIQNSAAVTYGAIGARGLAGNLTLSSGSLTAGDVLNVKGTTSNSGILTTGATANFTGAVTNTGTFNSNGVSNLSGAFANSGSTSVLSLGNDFKLAGNWSNAGTFNPNNKAVFFNGATGNQTITNTNATSSSTETFAYLVNDKAAGNLIIASNIIISGTSGDIFQLINGGGTTINGSRSITFNGNGGNILVSGAQRTIVGSGSNALININGNKTVRSFSGGSLVLGTNITTKLSNGLNFGAGLTTVSNILEINANGFVNINAPSYASTSTLIYNTGGAYNVNSEWTGNSVTAGVAVPQNVTITGNTTVNMPNTIRGLAGNITIGSGSVLNMNSTIGADLALAGNFTNNGTFNPNNTAVIFNGNDTTQTITGATTFDYVIVNKTGTLGSVALASSIIINKNLNLTNKCIVTGGNNLTLPNKTSTITSNANSYVNTTLTGKLIRLGIDNTSDWVFPVGVNAAGRYTPITIKNLSGATDIQVSANTTLTKAAAVPANALLAEWRVTSSAAVTANVRTDWTSAENNSVNTSGSGDLGVFNSTVSANYTLYDVTLSTYNTEATNVSLASTGVNSILVSNDDAIMLGNDECAGAKTVTVNATSLSGSTVGATTSLGPITCSRVSSTSRDVWYKFTTGAAGFYKIEVVRGTLSDPVIDLRSGVCNGTNIACADTFNATESITIELAAGTVYSYRVYNNGSSTGDGTFTTSVITVPSITFNPASLAFGNVSITTDSDIKTFTVKASLLSSSTGNVDLTAPTGYQLSLNGTTSWSSSLSLPFTTSTLAETTIYAKLNPSDCGDFNGNISATGGSAATANLAVTGKGIILVPTATAGTDITATTFTAHWNAVPGATGYKIDVYKKVVRPNAEDLFISEYVEGSSNNKYIEIFNGTGASIDLSNYKLRLYANGNGGTPDNDVALSGIIANNSTKVYKNAGATLTLPSGVSAENNAAVSFNGDDAVTLYKISSNSNVDIFGRIGSDPGTAWTGTGGYTTLDKTLVRKSSVLNGITVNPTGTGANAFSTLTTEWDMYNVDIVSDLGLHSFEGGTIITYNIQNQLTGNTTHYDVTGLTPNTQYYYVVRAITSNCESTNSTEIGVLTNNTVIWNDNAWSNTGGPDATLDAIIRSPFVTGNSGQSDFSVNNLTIESTGSLEIKADHGITVAGDITTPDNKIIIDSDGSLLQTKLSNGNSTNKVTAKRKVRMRKSDYTYWSSPVLNQVLLNTSNVNATNSSGGFSEGTPNNRIFRYNEPDDTFKATTDATFSPAKGYAIRGKEGYGGNLTADELLFNGNLHNGDYLIQIQKSKNTPSSDPLKPYTHGYNMIGNPYPSHIDFLQFYNLEQGNGSKNSDFINGKAWFWTNVPGAPATQGGSAYTPNNYAILSLAGGTPATGVDSGATTSPSSAIPNQYIKVAQGFIVEMKGTAPTGTTPNTATLKFDNSIRTNNSTGNFYNAKTSGNEINRYWVKLVSPNNVTNTILLAHMDAATNGYDADYDADLLTIADDSFFSKLDTHKLQIQAKTSFNDQDMIPLGVKYALDGTYKIVMADKEGVFAKGQKIYLHDKLSNTYTDLTQGNYTFQGFKGVDETRFEIVYRNNEVLGTENHTKSDFMVYKDGNHFVVKSSKSLGKVDLYDASGRLIQSKVVTENHTIFDFQMLPSGVYIVTANNSGNLRTKKVLK